MNQTWLLPQINLLPLFQHILKDSVKISFSLEKMTQGSISLGGEVGARIFCKCIHSKLPGCPGFIRPIPGLPRIFTQTNALKTRDGVAGGWGMIS